MPRFLKYFALSLGSLLLLGACGIFGAFLWITRDLPDITAMDIPCGTGAPSPGGGPIPLEKGCISVCLNEMPVYLRQAFAAAEDVHFFDRPARTMWWTVKSFFFGPRDGRFEEGASTFATALAKRVPGTTGADRRIRQAVLAARIETRLTKDEIICLYLNTIYLGSGAYGVEAAARVYFAEHASELTIAEAAVLAALPRSPSSANPYVAPEKARSRQVFLLERMRDAGFISEEQFQEALAQPLKYERMPGF